MSYCRGSMPPVFCWVHGMGQRKGRFPPHDFKRIGMSKQTPEGVAWACVVAYPSHGRRYYRFMAGLGDRIEIQKHIPGGACGTPLAEARASEAGRWIRTGRTNAEVLSLINSWGRVKASASGGA